MHTKLALCLCALVATWPGPAAHAEPPGEGPPPAQVRTEAVRAGRIHESRTLAAQVETRRRARVASEYEGLVVERLVEPGDAVKERQEIVRLRTHDLERRLDAARAVAAERGHDVLELENGARPEEKNEAQASVDLERARLDTLRWKLDAAQNLRTKGTISEDELRNAQLEVRLAEQRVLQSEAAQALVLAGPRIERVDQARARQAAADQEVLRLEQQLERMTVRAPFAGRVVSLHTEVGEWIDAGGTVMELVDLDEVDVVVPVPEDWAPGLRLGQPVTIDLPALPGHPFEGRIDRIIPEGNPRTRAIPVRVRVKNQLVDARPLLTAGMFAQVRLPVGPEQAALLVPKDALVLGGEQPIVYAVTPDGAGTRPVPVRITGAVDGTIAVEGDLKAGDRVVVEGNERLRPGQPIVDTPQPANGARPR